MTIWTQSLALELENPFTVSYGTSTTRNNVLVHISDGQFTGVGEAAVVPYYMETPERIESDIATLKDNFELTPLLLEDMLNTVPPMQSNAARAAVDMALHDLWGQHLGRPLYELWGLNPARSPISSFTVSLPEDDADYLTRLHAAREYSVIKLKLGSGSWEQDWHYVQIARQELDGQIAVDANGGWDADSALAIIPKLMEMGMVFIEQPVARNDWEGWRILHDALPEDRPPLIADESVQGVDHVPMIAEVVDGINIKLAKCGGLRPARQIIALARALGLKILLGCMVESSVAVTAAAHLAPLVDYADLDGNILIANDPYRGVTNTHGQLTLPSVPGLGVTPIAD